MPATSASDLSTIITDPNGAETMVREADQIGRHLSSRDIGLTTNQIRSLFGEVRQIQAQWEMGGENRDKACRRLILLKPKMAYRARREKGDGVKDLVKVLEPALNNVIAEADPTKQTANFKRFVEFFEAILAYHKAYGGN